jgi:hypothetical protein
MQIFKKIKKETFFVTMETKVQDVAKDLPSYAESHGSLDRG